uniref:Uncharacterized protein n=1 Tax=Oryza nivara TaxID=4536 RepID=A0A0E0HAJ3_ORYNI
MTWGVGTSASRGRGGEASAREEEERRCSRASAREGEERHRSRRRIEGKRDKGGIVIMEFDKLSASTGTRPLTAGGDVTIDSDTPVKTCT